MQGNVDFSIYINIVCPFFFFQLNKEKKVLVFCVNEFLVQPTQAIEIAYSSTLKLVLNLVS